MRKGFTLIELLIVVAIIAILAAIAVPNFLEAQVRSKVSRVKADLRSVATAIESYYVDTNKPPPQSAGLVGTPFDYVSDTGGGGGTGTLTYAITTPIAYLTNFMFYDPFVDKQLAIAVDERLFTYQAYQWKWPQRVTSAGFAVRPDATAEAGNEMWNGNQWKQVYGGWKLLSVGPDRNFYNIVPGAPGPHVAIPYDPTNGTVSMGNITRSQKEPEQRTFIP
jgi:prepilin-type N-terminal cleavage/methylation domain-containing protein